MQFLRKPAFYLTSCFVVGLLVWTLTYSISDNATSETNLRDIDFQHKFSNHKFNSVAEIQDYFRQSHYEWPLEPESTIPDLLIASLPDDFKSLDNIAERKTLFIRILLPIIAAELRHIRDQRQLIQIMLANSKSFDSLANQEWFSKVLNRYRVNKGLPFEIQKAEILKRVDEIPATLILAQAIIETGWGTSRFATEGNSLFGQWTFDASKGITPTNRQEGKTHSVKAFATLQESVRAYIRNINRNSAYRELRDIRLKMRKSGQKLDAFTLAKGLHRYSETGTDYVESIQKLLTSEEFKILEQSELFS